jgi:major membrane immunogen (membrane-anchored lipoprotein)
MIMKRFFTMILVLVAALAFAGCQEKEFKTDGEFTAFEVSVHRGAPMVTSVTVTVKNGKITKYFIDARQGTVTKDAENKITAVAWNEKTKKELGNAYGMKGVGPEFKFEDGVWTQVEGGTSKKEWFEQANAIEAQFLAGGVDSVVVTDERISNVAGVTVKDGGYTKLAKEAVANAKAGKVITFEHSLHYNGTANLTWVELVVEKGKAKSLFIDCLQSTLAADGSGLVWNTKSKKELGNDYGMKQASDIGKEWFEQANALEAEILAKGPDAIKVVDGVITDVAGVSIKDGGYTKLAKAAYKAAGLTK